MSHIFSFPSTVNEHAARIVAAGVVVQGLAFVVSGIGWFLVPLTIGFAARVLTGPTLSPLGQFATRLATPWLERRLGLQPRPVPGAPKRFAQLIGLTTTMAASLAWVAGLGPVTIVLMMALIVAAGLESGLGLCLGCVVYNALWGCPDCADLSRRLVPQEVQAS